MKIEPIPREALSILAQERAELPELLMASHDALSQAKTGQLWFQEAARRAAEMDQGFSKRIPADVVRLETQALLK